MTTCPQCGGPLTLLAAIEDPAVIGKILSHLGLPTRAPPRAPARFDAFLQTAEFLPGFRFSFGADTPPLPSSYPPTPQWSDILARSENNEPVRPSSQDELPPRGQRRLGIESAMRSLVLCDSLKKAF